MEPTTLFYLIVLIVAGRFLFDRYLKHLNSTRFNAPLPEELSKVYDEEQYLRSQHYKARLYRFGRWSGGLFFLLTMLVLFLDGFAWVDQLARKLVTGELAVGLVYFGILALASELVSLPFSYYRTFVIEEEFGFNTTTRKTFWSDKLKSLLLMTVIGGGLMAGIIFIYQRTGTDFWWYAWGVLTLFALLMNLSYSRLIVPLFNKQTPLPEGTLRQQIADFAKEVGFDLKQIFVIDGSKRSTRANAYFSGFGREKRITLYDTLIKDLDEEEIVAVLAHEVGHYKKKHLIYNLLLSVTTTGFTLWLLSQLLGSQTLSAALGAGQASFHIGLTAFALLYTPVSELTGLLANALSRKFEYQADAYARSHYEAKHLVNALIKLSRKNLSNLTPHPAFVRVHYSHPTLLQRLRALTGTA